MTSPTSQTRMSLSFRRVKFRRQTLSPGAALPCLHTCLHLRNLRLLVMLLDQSRPCSVETGRSPPWILTDIPSQAPFEAPLRNLRLLDQVMLLEVMQAMEAVQAMEVKASRQTLSPGAALSRLLSSLHNHTALVRVVGALPIIRNLRNLRLLVMLLEVMQATMEAVQAMEVKASRQTLSSGAALSRLLSSLHLRNLRLQVMLVMEAMQDMEAMQAMEVKASRQTLSPGAAPPLRRGY